MLAFFSSKFTCFALFLSFLGGVNLSSSLDLKYNFSDNILNNSFLVREDIPKKIKQDIEIHCDQTLFNTLISSETEQFIRIDIEEEEDFFSSKKRLKFIQVVNTTTFRSLKVSDQQNQRVVCRIPLDFSSKIPLYISNQVYLI